MPRIKSALEVPRLREGGLVERLADELKNERASGQPLIYETVFPTEKIRVNVIWDKWDHLTFEDRTDTILSAYQRAEGSEYRQKIALASGLTVPEAYGAGMLPFQIIPVLRRSDRVTAEQCRELMVAEGASILLSPDSPQLRFATAEEAEAARARLVAKLPESDEVWTITREVGRMEDWTEN